MATSTGDSTLSVMHECERSETVQKRTEERMKEIERKNIGFEFTAYFESKQNENEKVPIAIHDADDQYAFDTFVVLSLCVFMCRRGSIRMELEWPSDLCYQIMNHV